jgi:hypothetical protein
VRRRSEHDGDDGDAAADVIDRVLASATDAPAALPAL